MLGKMTAHKTKERRQGVIGIDLGGTKMRLALFDSKFNVLGDIKEKTRPQKGERHFRKTLFDGLDELQAQAKKQKLQVVAVGMACPGFVDADKGVIVDAPNIVFLRNYPILERLTKKTGLPAVILNDVQAGVLGEHALGAGKGCRNLIGIFLGTGIGGGLVLNGELYRGAAGAAGEIGQFLVDPMGPLSGSDRKGVLDNVVGRHAIAAEAAAMAAKQWAPNLYQEAGTNLSEIKGGVLAKAIEAGDKKIEELVRSRARLVGIVLANLVNFLSPDRVVLGGGLVEAMPRLIVNEVEKSMREFAVPYIARRVAVKAAALGGHSVTKGVAKLAWDQAAGAARSGAAK